MKKYGVWIGVIVMMLFCLGGCNKKNQSSLGAGESAVSTEQTSTEETTTESAEKEDSDEEYILADSSEKRVTNSDLRSLTSRELQLARNEIYARHGRKFDTSWIQNYFNSKSWYKGRIEADDFNEDKILSSIEKYNTEFISDYEKDRNENNSGSSASGKSSSSQKNSSSSSGNRSGSYSGGSSSSGRTTSSGSGSGGICSYCGGLGHCKYCLSGSCSMCNGSRMQRCYSCGGDGKCGACGGSGYKYQGTGIMFRKVKCTSCGGLGRCRNCSGTGRSSCSYCSGTGTCNYCHGNYTCIYCGGTGKKY